MRARRRYRSAETSALGIAGWLFAELAMILVVITFGAEHKPPAQAVPALPSTTSPTTTAAPNPSTPQAGLLLDSVVFYVQVPASGQGVLEDFRKQLDAKVRDDQRIGFIQLFGKDRGGVSGAEVSRQLMRIVVGKVPELPRQEQIRAYFGEEGTPGTVQVEMFLMTSMT